MKKSAGLCLLLMVSVMAGSGWGWSKQELDESGDYTGQYCSLSVIAGQPAIAYYSAEGPVDKLKYARLGDAWVHDTVDENIGATPYASLAALPGGQPAIAYYDAVNDDLKYAWHDGSGWIKTVVESANDTGRLCSLAMVGGKPAISYIDGTKSDLKYAHYTGTAWVIDTVDDNALGNDYALTSLVVLADGRPAIAYYARNLALNNQVLKYAEFNGTVWNRVTVDESASGIGRYASMKLLADGTPVIAYYDITNKALKYARREGGVWTTQTLYSDTQYQCGLYCSLFITPSGQPAIVWHKLYKSGSYADSRIMFSWLENNQWRHYEIEYHYRELARHISAALLADNRAAFACYDPYNYALKFYQMDYPMIPAALESSYTATAWLESQGTTTVENEPISIHAYLGSVEGCGDITTNVSLTNFQPGGYQARIELQGRACLNGECRQWNEETGECLLWGRCIERNEAGECLQWLDGQELIDPQDTSGHITGEIKVEPTASCPAGTEVYLSINVTRELEDPGMAQTIIGTIRVNGIAVKDVSAAGNYYVGVKAGQTIGLDFFYKIESDGYYHGVINADLLFSTTIPSLRADICGRQSANPDGRVDLYDFACLSRYWLASGCESETGCHSVDIDQNGMIGLSDLEAMVQDWLKAN